MCCYTHPPFRYPHYVLFTSYPFYVITNENIPPFPRLCQRWYDSVLKNISFSCVCVMWFDLLWDSLNGLPNTRGVEALFLFIIFPSAFFVQ